MGDLRIAQMLDQQLANDPFARAQNQAASQAQQNNNSQLITGGPGDPTSMLAFKNQQQAKAPDSPQPQAQGVVELPTSDQQASFTNSQLAKMLQQNGIDNKGLAYNQLGRMQLIGRLRSKYGDQYNQVPQALDILSAFDKEISKLPTNRSLNAMIGAGERTLRAIYGGK